MFKKLLPILLCLTLFISILPIHTLAETGPVDSAENELANKAASEELEEVESERDEFSKTYVDEEGNFTKEIYADPIHTEIEGEMTEISTDVTLDKAEGVLETESTKLEAAYPAEMSSDEKITYSFGNHNLEFSNIMASNGSKEFSLNPGATTRVEENKVFYEKVLPGIDLRHVSLNSEVKEDWIINDYQGIHQFNYEVTTDLIAQLEADGSIGFYEDQNLEKKVFKLPAPVMEDSNINDALGHGVKSTDLHYELNTNKNNVYSISLNVDKKWLENKERVYPIYVDPSVSIDTLGDSYVTSAQPDSNFNKEWNSVQGEYVLKVGKYDASTGTNYAFSKFSVVGELKNAIVDSATLEMFVTHAYDETEKTGLWVDRVNSAWYVDTLTWNNKPSSTNIANTLVSRDQWAKFNVKQTVQDWINGTYGNFGFKFHTNGNGQTYWKQLSAAENANKAKLVIAYHYNTPEKPTTAGFSINKDTGYFDLSWKESTGAIGYKVAIFNGKDYQTINVGDTTNWSTKGKKIWPTSADIAAGKYQLRTDGTGSELSIDPSKVYENAFKAGASVNSSGRQNYWFKVKAIYPGGESPLSLEDKPTLPLGKPTLSGSIYSGIPVYSGGHADLKWDTVAGATGYKVAVFNGIGYQEFDVGLTNSWTTKGKGIWPTKEEIEQGLYNLHHDGQGRELSLDPSKVYVNSKGSYPTSKNYWFKVRAYSSTGHADSAYSNWYTPTIPIRTFTDISLDKGKNYINLNWSPVPNADSYEIIVNNLGIKSSVYTGNLPSFKHVGLASGNLYDYKLYAYDANGELIDIAKVSTFTIFEDGLDALNIDTFITSLKIKVKWNPLINVEEYAISKDENYIKTTNTSEFVETDFSIGDQIEYTINSLEKLNTAEESANQLHEPIDINGSNVDVVEEIVESEAPLEIPASVVESIIETEETITNHQGYAITVPIDTLLDDRSIVGAAASTGSTTIRHRVFLPPKYKRLSNKLNIYYGGDNRLVNNRSIFSEVNGTHRTQADVIINWTKGKGCTGNNQITLKKSIGPSHEYIKNIQGIYVRTGTLTASSSGLKVSCISNTGSYAKYVISHSIGIPFWSNTPPNIDYKYTEEVYRNGVTVIKGSHDQFPAHEIYRKDSNRASYRKLYTFDPYLYGTTIDYLWPTKPNRKISVVK